MFTMTGTSFKRAYFILHLERVAAGSFHTDELYLSIRRTCCAGVDSVTDCDYNNYIENPKNVLRKVQSAFCPLLALFQVNYQNILKNTCRNKPAKRLNKPVPERQGRNRICPTKGIDTFPEHCSLYPSLQ